MKIQCGQCERKYKVPDEKVGGKAFKVRCRNCESMIIVRPDGSVSTRPPAGSEQPGAVSEPPASQAPAAQQGQASAPPQGFGGAEEQADWHVVVEGDQQGPYAPVVLSEMLTVGTIDWDAYVWREGFDGWLPARDVPELVEAITGQPYDPSYSSESADDGGLAATTGDADLDADVDSAMDNVFGGGDAETEESPFAPSVADRASSLGRGISEAPAAGASGGDFMDFGGASSPPSAGGSARPAPHSSAPAGGSLPPQSQPPAAMGGGPSVAAGGGVSAASADPSQMTGQRNENSVLFSLSNLQALAGEEGAQPKPDPALGHASGDASGLIDIRALASATGIAGGASGTGGVSASGSGNDDVDDLMSIGTGSALSANLAAPVLSAAEDDGDNKKWLILGGALFAAIVVVGIILAVALGGDDEQVAMAPQPIPGTAAATQPVPEPSPAQQAPSSEKQAADERAANDEVDDDESEDVEDDDSEDSASGRSRSRRRSPRRTARSSGSSPSPKPAPQPRRERDSIDALLDDATGGGGSSRGSSGGGSSSANLPDAPNKSQVVKAMNSVSGKVRACGQGKSGVAMVSVSVAGSTGRVKSATVSGSFQGTPTGSCVARAVRSARFPKFKRSTFTVKYPFRI